MLRKRTAVVYSKHGEARNRQEVTTRKEGTLNTAFCCKRMNICWTNKPTPTAQDAERHLIYWSTGWIAPALLKWRGWEARIDIFDTTQQPPLSTFTVFWGKSVALQSL